MNSKIEIILIGIIILGLEYEGIKAGLKHKFKRNNKEQKISVLTEK